MNPNLLRLLTWFKSATKWLLPILVLLVFSLRVHAQKTTGTTADGLVWSQKNGQITITGHSGYIKGTVSIPSMIPDYYYGTVVTIGAKAFDQCGDMTGVLIADSVTSIGDNAFSNTGLTSLTIPDSITSIGNGAFWNTNLTSVTIPASVTSIGSNAFTGYNLTAITVDASNTVYSSSPDGVLFDKIQKTLIQCPSGKTGGYTIPSSVTSIGQCAFFSCGSLTSVTIPYGVTSIGDGAFYWCGFKSLSIPTSVTSIGQQAFYSSGLSSVMIPSSVTSIGQEAFGYCQGLSSVTIPSSVTSMGYGAFDTCVGLKSVTIGGGVIGDSAFYHCSNLTSVTISDGVTSIGASAFYECSGLSSVTIPSSVTSIGNYAFLWSSLESAFFLGNAPTMGVSVFNPPLGFGIYYYNGATGFSSPPWNWFFTFVNMGDPSPVKSWLISKGFSFDADLQSVHNNDGVPLLLSYALNLDPTQNQSRNIPKPFVSGNNLCLTYYAAALDVTYHVQTSTDMLIWTEGGVSLSGPDAYGCYTASIPLTDPCRFMRLVVTH